MMSYPPKRARILSGQCGEGARGDFLDRAAAGNPAVLRAELAPVVVDQRPRLRAVDLEAPAHRVLAVVVALHQRLAGEVVAPFALWRIELDVVAAARSRMHAPSAHAQDDLLVRHVDLEDVVD